MTLDELAVSLRAITPIGAVHKIGINLWAHREGNTEIEIHVYFTPRPGLPGLHVTVSSFQAALDYFTALYSSVDTTLDLGDPAKCH